MGHFLYFFCIFLTLDSIIYVNNEQGFVVTTTSGNFAIKVMIESMLS